MRNTNEIKARVARVIASGHAPQDVVRREHLLENFREEDGDVLVDLERHPPVCCPSVPANSSVAHFLVRQTYRMHGDAMDLVDEVCEGVTVKDMDVLVTADAFMYADAVFPNFPDDGEMSPGEWANAQAESAVPTLREQLFPIEGVTCDEGFTAAWDGFLDRYIAAWKRTFRRELIRRLKGAHRV